MDDVQFRKPADVSASGGKKLIIHTWYCSVVRYNLLILDKYPEGSTHDEKSERFLDAERKVRGVFSKVFGWKSDEY